MVWAFSFTNERVVGNREMVSDVASPMVVLPLTVKSVVAVKVVVVVNEPGVVIADGNDRVTAPVAAEAVIWLAVPAIELTPVEEVKQVEVVHTVPLVGKVKAVAPEVVKNKVLPAVPSGTIPELSWKVQVLSAVVKSKEVIIPLKVLVAVPD